MSNSKKTDKSSKTYQNTQSPSRVSEMVAEYQTPFQKAAMARHGISTAFVTDLMKSLEINKAETARLIDISPKTLDRHLQGGRLFKGLQSDRILELADLYNQGIEVFGNKQKLLKWLTSNSPALGNTTPREWLDTQQGIEAVSHELGRIKHGIFA